MPTRRQHPATSPRELNITSMYSDEPDMQRLAKALLFVLSYKPPDAEPAHPPGQDLPEAA